MVLRLLDVLLCLLRLVVLLRQQNRGAAAIGWRLKQGGCCNRF